MNIEIQIERDMTRAKTAASKEVYAPLSKACIAAIVAAVKANDIHRREIVEQHMTGLMLAKDDTDNFEHIITIKMRSESGRSPA